MPPKKPDRRTERTRKALMSAFVELMLTRGYMNVSVEDIAEAADVGRSTFYIHYKSKEGLLREAVKRPSTPLAIIVGHDIAPEILSHQLLHFYEQRQRNGTFFTEPTRSLWVRCLAEMIEPRLAALSRQFHARPVLPLPLIALQIAEAEIAFVRHWLLSRSAVKADLAATALIASVHAMLAALLAVKPETPLFIACEKIKVVRQT